MKKLVSIVILVIFLLVVFFNYTYIMSTVISKLQYKEAVTAFYEDAAEPKDKIADISIAALDSIVAEELGDKQYRFVALDTKVLGDFSDGEVQYLLTYFKKYSDRVMCKSLEQLKKVGLCTPFKKSLCGGVLLSVDEVCEITNENAELRITKFESGIGAASYICKLIYTDGQWKVDKLELKYIS